MSSVTTGAIDDPSPPGRVRVAHGRDDRSPSLAVVEAIADLAGVAPEALGDETGIVLYDHVDPDALDALVAHRPDGAISLSFSVDEYDVRVGRDAVVARLAE
jgi:hypothetical protein